MVYFWKKFKYNIIFEKWCYTYLHHARSSGDGSRGDAVHANAEATPLQGLSTRAAVDCTFGGAGVDLVPLVFDDRFLMKTVLDDDVARAETIKRNKRLKSQLNTRETTTKFKLRDGLSSEVKTHFYSKV